MYKYYLVYNLKPVLLLIIVVCWQSFMVNYEVSVVGSFVVVHPGQKLK